MNDHLTTALARERTADLRRAEHELQRARVVASLVALPATGTPRRRRLPLPFPPLRG